jgi:subtilisin-like proprotein convertase family protein
LGDLGVELTSPAGTTSVLLNLNNSMTSANFSDAVFLSNAFYQELSAGTWTLRVIDGGPLDLGTLTNWKLNFFGQKPIPPEESSPPSAPTGLSHAAEFSSLTQSPPITWNASDSSVLRFEYSVGSAPGESDILDWQTHHLATALQISGLSLSVGNVYYVNLRAVNYWEQGSSVVSSSGWTVVETSP